MRLSNIKIFIFKKNYDIYSVLVNKNNIDKIIFLTVTNSNCTYVLYNLISINKN